MSGGINFRGEKVDNKKIPYRIFPGGLSVSRSFGDINAKDP